MRKILMFRSIDLLGAGLLPRNWGDDIRGLAHSRSFSVYMDGHHSDSRELPDTKGSEYQVVTGDHIAVDLPWLNELYHVGLCNLASDFARRPVVASENQRAGININMLVGAHARYEWHVDPCPITGILFVTSHAPTNGGSLVLELEGEKREIEPEKGYFFLFRAGQIPHCVSPLKSGVRLSVPMMYYFADQKQEWSADLEFYLYGART